MQGNLKAFRIALMLVLSLFFGTVSAQTVTGNVVDETGMKRARPSSALL